MLKRKGDFDTSKWTNWSSCCKGETKRRKVVMLGGELKNKTETLTCNTDQCPGTSTIHQDSGFCDNKKHFLKSVFL